MSRILSGKLTIRPEAMDLRRTVQLAIEAARPVMLARQLTLIEDLSPTDDLQMAGDPARLQQVVWNLLSNAVKFTPAGGNVTISVRRNDGEAIIVVTDTGCGIRPEFLPHVFERFRQADGSTTRQHGGLGLGLAIVKHLVEMHGGAVQAASDGEGRGAAFTVRLPVRAPVVLPAPAANSQPPVPFDSLQGKHVLLVEDDVDASEVLRTILERAGAVVHTASSGAHALTLLRESRFDLLISDIGMPQMDGYGVIRRVREREAGGARRIPAIALTAFAQKEDRLQAIAAGYDLHLAKPVVPENLLRAVAGLTGAI
jgi:CheY-like chemotaxis protein